MANEVKWIRITTDMFDNRKIKHLRKLPEGDSIVLIWVMLLTMAGRCNAGGMIFLTESIPYTTKMLADELDFEENTVKLALQALEQLDMVVMKDECFCIAGWEEHQNADGLEKIREQNRLRKRAQREREKPALPAAPEPVPAPDSAGNAPASRDSHVTVTEDVTQCHAVDIDKEERLKKESNKEKKKKESAPSGFDAVLAEIPDDRLRSCYAEFVKMRKAIKAPMTEKALRMLVSRVNELEPDNIDRQVLLLETAIMNSWKSVYPLKDQQLQALQGQAMPKPKTTTDDFMDKLKSMYVPETGNQ